MKEHHVLNYVNVFQGNGEIDLPKPYGIAAAWRFLKAQCGNTSPFAAYPFGQITCGAYTGGYPTGYGNHIANSCGSVRKFDAKLKGFSHFQQSGTGNINVFYHYALVTPRYTDLGKTEDEITDEYAVPGMYSCTMKESGIQARLAVSENAAYHKYIFNGNGMIQIDFSCAGLAKETKISPARVEDYEIRIEKEYVLSKIVVFGKAIYFAVKCKNADSVYLWNDFKRLDDKIIRGHNENGTFGCAFEVVHSGEIKLCASLTGFDDAVGKLAADDYDMEEVIQNTADVWESYLHKIHIKTNDEKQKEIFYSNLYHSIIKPCRWKERYTDFSTMWDLYKTQLPLVFSLYGDEANGIVETMLNLIEQNGHSPINVNMAADNDIAMQAKMLMEYSLADAYYRGIRLDSDRVLHDAMLDLEYHKDVFDIARLDRYTHMLDAAGACYAMHEIAKETGNKAAMEEFGKHLYAWTKVYDPDTGLLSTESKYYEGDHWNYSFRFVNDMERRIEIAGGRDRFIQLLDYFFGYTRDSVEQLSEPEGKAFLPGVHSFEGYNNEPDMEAPYAYTFADRHDRVCEIIRAGMQYMFTDGRGGLPGNNDSGALSSCYVWNAIGLFPVAGQNLMLIGSPSIDEATITLSNGRVFKIIVNNNSADNIYVENAILNGTRLEKMMFTVRELMQGGILELYMQGKQN